MGLSGSRDFTLTATQIINSAVRKITGENCATNKLGNALEALELIVKSLQSKDIYLWSWSKNIQRLTTSSVVVGTDGNDYECILNHTSSTNDKPITGTNYTNYWKALGTTGAGSVWATSTNYTSICQYALSSDVLDIQAAYINDLNGVDTQLTLMSIEDYAALGNKYETTGRPSSLILDKQLTPNIYLYQYPDSVNYILNMWVTKKLQDFDNVNNNADLRDSCLRFLIWELAGELGDEYGINDNTIMRWKAFALASKEDMLTGIGQKVSTIIRPEIRRY